ncbi:ABC transporter substrate-binding protein [Frankia sp. AgB1.9]|uniref:ABC transporter substrate-binding protein n=1 Tax=unclassified Frankia TaxID=2632575 RepID=UPI0019344370|nr:MULTISPECIES: ABC transporter substrate-binding protein [unclassified Frankia]MBL7487638.1 ABC transporter substrate-binding protein [Frankia sp. AgW1.1]MBL7550016.1 ABC transporter substrate-binding protein [Frankia sp. AgB1.9]MBL7621919.1 ABC transporter substrate-binding protein [Frankia sp. AgB1.8]
MFLRSRSLARTATLVAAASSLAVLSACDGPGGAGARSAASSCTAPGVTRTEVKAGLLFSDSGAGQSAFGAYRGGVDARLGIANAAGGIDGRTIVYSWRDDSSDPAQNLVGAQNLVQADGVLGLIEGTTVAAGSAQYLDGEDIPVVGVGGEIAWTEHANMFAWSYYTTRTGSNSVWGDFIRSQGGTRAVLINSAAGDATQNFHRQLSESLESAGVHIDQTFDVTAGMTNFDSLAQRMKAAHIDTLTGSVFPDALARILPAARAAGVNLKVVLAPLGYDPTLLTLIGPALAHTVMYLDFVPFELNTAAHSQLVSAMETYAPQVQPPAQESAAFGWLSADMFLRGLQAAGPCPTRESFIRGLRAVRDYDGGGLLPHSVDFAVNRGQLSSCWDFVRVSDDGSRFIPLQPVARCGNPLT